MSRIPKEFMSPESANYASTLEQCREFIERLENMKQSVSPNEIHTMTLNYEEILDALWPLLLQRLSSLLPADVRGMQEGVSTLDQLSVSAMIDYCLEKGLEGQARQLEKFRLQGGDLLVIHLPDNHSVEDGDRLTASMQKICKFLEETSGVTPAVVILPESCKVQQFRIKGDV